METQHIAFIRQIAEHENISSASREIGLTQSALTKILMRLEDQLGGALFERGRRGVTLTALGHLFLERMEVVEQELVRLEKERLALRAGLTGRISIGVGQFWLGNVLPVVLARLSRDAPNIQVRVESGPRDDLLQHLRQGKLEFVLGRITEATPDTYVCDALADVRLFFLVRDGHPLTRLGRPVTHKTLPLLVGCYLRHQTPLRSTSAMSSRDMASQNKRCVWRQYHRTSLLAW